MSGFEPIKINKVASTPGEFAGIEGQQAEFGTADEFSPISGEFFDSSFSGADFSPSAAAQNPGEEGAEPSLEQEDALREVREEYFEQGRQEGIELGRKEVEQELQAAQRLRASLESVREQVFARSVKDVADAITLIASQVVRRELSISPASIEDLVLSVLDQVRRSDEFVVRLSAAEYDKLGELTPIIMNRLGRDATFRVEADSSLEPGGVIVETDYGRIDASVEGQIEAFAEAVESWVREEVEVSDD